MKRTAHNHLALFCTILLSITLTGCYTLVRHPEAVDSADTGDFKRCVDCHGGFYHPGPYEYFYGGVWWDYYSIPWWYDEAYLSSHDFESRSIYERRPIRSGDQPGMDLPAAPVYPLAPKTLVEDPNDKEDKDTSARDSYLGRKERKRSEEEKKSEKDVKDAREATDTEEEEDPGKKKRK